MRSRRAADNPTKRQTAATLGAAVTRVCSGAVLTHSDAAVTRARQVGIALQDA